MLVEAKALMLRILLLASPGTLKEISVMEFFSTYFHMCSGIIARTRSSILVEVSIDTEKTMISKPSIRVRSVTAIMAVP